MEDLSGLHGGARHTGRTRRLGQHSSEAPFLILDRLVEGIERKGRLLKHPKGRLYF